MAAPRLQASPRHPAERSQKEDPTMWRKLAIAAVCTALPAAALAHLCNDVFDQAKDNLAVKVDVRDGQLRIGQEASFKVYLLNTMDRGIATISLQVNSNEFTAEVKPDKLSLPVGKKMSFDVVLKRNPGVADGKYKIGLTLYNTNKKSQVFTTTDLDSAAGIVELPKGAAVKVDGASDEAEWGKSFACTDFYTCAKQKFPSGTFMANQPAQDQARFRVAADAENLYCLLQFAGGTGAKADEAKLYVAASADAKPVTVVFDRLTAKASAEKGPEGIEVKASADKSMLECKVPLELLGLKGAKSFRLNFTRRVTDADGKQTVTYWRGNGASLQEPIVYGQFKLAE
jgi:hypothetical protein